MRGCRITSSDLAAIPARHDLWRRVSCDWLGMRVVQGILAEDEAHEPASGPAKRAYRAQEGVTL